MPLDRIHRERGIGCVLVSMEAPRRIEWTVERPVGIALWVLLEHAGPLRELAEIVQERRKGDPATGILQGLMIHAQPP